MRQATSIVLVTIGAWGIWGTAAAEELVGFSPDGSYYATERSSPDSSTNFWLCLTDRAAGSPSWPVKVKKPKGEDCTQICDDISEQCAKATRRKLKDWGVARPAASRVGPHGETVALKASKKGRGDDATTEYVAVVTRGAQQALVPIGEKGSVLEISSVYWRPDGAVVAVYLGQPPSPADAEFGGEITIDLLGVGALKDWKPIGKGDRDAASQENARGMHAYRARALDDAVEDFRAAVGADPSYVQGHYNLASLASRTGDAKTALAELAWLTASAEPEAKAKLKKALTDPDLDFVSADAGARKLLGAPPLATLDPAGRLTERNGTFTLDGTPCAGASMTLVFKAAGKLTLEYREQCTPTKSPIEKKLTGAYTATGVTVGSFHAWPGPAQLTPAACVGVDAKDACFTLTAGATTLGPFHRGRSFR